MKKILLINIIILLLTGCNQPNKKENLPSKNFILVITPTKVCNNNIKEYYKNQDRTVYLVCIDEIYLKRETAKDMTLKYHFANINQSFDDSLKQLVSDIKTIEYLKDGGTKIYKHQDYTIILCNTTEGNKDVYIGNNYMMYEQEFCHN